MESRPEAHAIWSHDVPRTARRRRIRWVGAIAAGGAFLLALLGVRVLGDSAPVLERDASLLGTVTRGRLVREVHGSGRLVPEEIRIVTARTAGTVERVLIRPGAAVAESTLLVVLSNPDVELAALQSRQDLAEAEAALLELRPDLEADRLTRQVEVSEARTGVETALRAAGDDSTLAARGLLAREAARRSRERAAAARVRLEAQEARSALLAEAAETRIRAMTERVRQLRAIAAYHQERRESMWIRAGGAGVLQDLDLQAGQWVQPGAPLARVARPGRLRAELRIPQVQARDVRPGLSVAVDARIDTLAGHVTRVDPNVQNGTVRVEVGLDGPLPRGARPDLAVDGNIEVDRWEDVLQVARPPFAEANAVAGVFKLTADGDHAVRTRVRFGEGSVDRVRVLDGLREGDCIVVSDTGRWDGVDRIRIR